MYHLHSRMPPSAEGYSPPTDYANLFHTTYVHLQGIQSFGSEALSEIEHLQQLQKHWRRSKSKFSTDKSPTTYFRRQENEACYKSVDEKRFLYIATASGCDLRAGICDKNPEKLPSELIWVGGLRIRRLLFRTYEYRDSKDQK